MRREDSVTSTVAAPRGRVFNPPDTRTLREYVAKSLREAIVAGRVKPGERLDEDRLSRDLGVSRTPLREALLELEHQGLVVSRRRQGTFVVDLAEEEIQRINSLRIVLEAEALRLCRQKLTPPMERRLSSLVEKMEDPLHQQSSIESQFLVWEFHTAIWHWSGNDSLERVVNMIATPVFIVRALRSPHPSSMEHHRTLLEFIQGTCKQTAEEVMLDHLRLRYTIPAQFSSFGTTEQLQARLPAKTHETTLKGNERSLHSDP